MSKIKISNLMQGVGLTNADRNFIDRKMWSKTNISGDDLKRILTQALEETMIEFKLESL